MRKITLLIILLLFQLNSFSQRRISLPFSSSYDENAMLAIGIQYNYIHQNYQISLKENWQTNYPIDYGADINTHLGELKSIQSKSSTGISVSIPIDFRVDDNLYFTFNPSFMFINNLGIEYTSMNNTLAPLTRRSRHVISSIDGTNFNAFEFPLSIKFRSDEKTIKNNQNRYRAYLIGGLRYTQWIGINGEYNNLSKEVGIIPHSIILKPNYLSWEAGIGVDIFLPYFKVSPELKFNQSLSNVLNPNNPLADGNKFMAPIEKALIRNIYFGLIFQ